MTILNNLSKHCKVLELDRVLEMLASCTGNPDAAELARDITPSADFDEVGRLLAQTDNAYVLMAKYSAPSFGSMKNIKSALRRAQAGADLSMRELIDVGENLRVYRSLAEWRNKIGDKCELDMLFEGITPLRRLENKINSSIISEEEVSDSASAELANIRRKIRAAENSVRERLDKMIHSSSMSKMLQEPVVTIRSGRYVVPVKLEYRSSVPGLVHDTSSSGATVFVEPMGVVEANNEVRVLRSKEEAEIERIISELSSEIGENADTAAISYDCAVELCLIFGKARLAFEMKASMPTVNRDGRINLIKARHPLLDPKTVVPVSVSIGKDYDTLVITGPNTGGKTVTLKTIGLLTLMTACGLMIPVSDNSEIAVFNSVMADIGDEQSIEQSLSTFSSHMVNLVEMLNNADDNTLILVDELGAGTDPIEGAALAMAVIEAFRNKGCMVAATTHYAELKAYAIDTAGVENACCEFDVKSLRPTYRLLIGIPGRSNAFAISERLGLSPEIVRHAKELISSEDKKFEGVVRSLEQARKAAEDEHNELEKLKAEAASAKLKAEQHLRDVEQEREKIIEKARAEAGRMVDKANRGATAMLNEIEDLRKKAGKGDSIDDIARRARAAVKKGDKALDIRQDDEDTNYVLPRPLVIGDYVHVIDANRGGKVTKLSDKSGTITVNMNGLSMKVKESRVRLIDAPKAKKSQPSRRTVSKSLQSRATRDVRTEIDLRGQTVDEALMELDRFIDGAVLSGITNVTCIHGKGTGALRSAIQEHLRRHKQVKSFRLGVYGEGETGVTIIELK